MALNKGLLTKEALLQGLSEEQINAIVTLSKNDEDMTFNTKFAALHNELDEAIKEVTGKGKNANEKTSTYMKRIMSEQKAEIGTLTTAKATLESKVTDLEGKIAAGSGDKGLIETQKATIADLTNKYNTLKTDYDNQKSSLEKERIDWRIGAEIEAALNTIAFKGDAKPEILEVLKAQAVKTVKGMQPTYIKGDNGQERLIFKTPEGAEMRNPDNQLQLYTAKELLAKELTRYGVVDDGKPAGGAGGKGGTPKPITSIGGAKSKEEANKIIGNILSQSGLVWGTKEYQDKFDEIYRENLDTIDALPLQ